MSDDGIRTIRSFHDAVAIVTGGASGIGAALGQELARGGDTFPRHIVRIRCRVGASPRRSLRTAHSVREAVHEADRRSSSTSTHAAEIDRELPAVMSAKRPVVVLSTGVLEY